ncbi:AGAP012403-PA, partial [Anopheles gambiae str. PEST]
NDSTPLFNTSSSGNSPNPGSPLTTFASLSAGHHSTSPPATLLASPSPSSSPTTRTTTATTTTTTTITPTTPTGSSSNRSSSAALNHHPHVEKRLASDASCYGSGTPSKKTKLSSSTSSSASSFHVYTASTSGNGVTMASGVLQPSRTVDGLLCTSSPTSGGTTGHGGTHERLNIHDKLRELFLELLAEDSSESDRLSLRSTSFLLEKLILREQLNTLIVNLYPGNKGYSLAFRLGSQEEGCRNVSKSGATASLSGFPSMGTGVGPPSGNDSMTSNAGDLNSENLQETIRWPYEEEDLLESIDREELPLVLVDILESKCPALFYCGCVVAEVRDYRQSFPIFTCDTFHVLLKPTNQTLLADVNILTAEGEWSAEDKLALESQLVLATAEPLCLDPNPAVGMMAINQQHRRQLLNTAPIRRQAKKFSQVAVNRKRKTDQFTHNFGLELSDFMNKYRARPPRQQSIRRGVVSFTLPKKPSEVVPTVNLPNLELPELASPSEVNVEKYARKYEAPKESRDCIPQLIEEYILETDRVVNRGDTRVYHIKLSIFQRPSNSEYLGELYVDRDYRENERNGEACQFSLGTRAHAHRYIQQFTEIFTEEGRKSVKITHLVPGQIPKVTGHQQQMFNTNTCDTSNDSTNIVNTGAGTTANNIAASQGTTITLQTQPSSQQQPQQQLQPNQQPQQTLSLSNGSLLLVQPSGQISNLTMTTNAAGQQQLLATAAGAGGNAVTGAQSFTFSSGGQTATIINQAGARTIGNTQQTQQPGNIRVTMSALATQLASPPAILTTSNLPQSFNRVLNINTNAATATSTAAVVAAAFGGAIRRVSATGNPAMGTDGGIQLQIQGLTATQSSANLSAGGNISNITSVTSESGLRRTAVSDQLQIQSIASPGSDHSNASSTSLASNGGGAGSSVGTLNGANANSIIFNNMTSLSASLANTASSGVTQPTLATGASENGDGTMQNPVSVVGATTVVGLVNLQGLNFASLHGAMTSIPGLQNVQVQIPGLAQPISLSLSSTPSGGATSVLNNTAANNAGQTTSLLVSVPVTNTTQVVNTINASGTSNILSGNSQTTQTVVLTNPQTSGSSLLSLPIGKCISPKR